MRWLPLLLLLACAGADRDADPCLADDGSLRCDLVACLDRCEPPAETCQPGEDADGDGLSACDDPDCTCVETDCADAIDNDGDGPADCDDPDCLDACTPDRPPEAIVRFALPGLHPATPPRLVPAGDDLLLVGRTGGYERLTGEGPDLRIHTSFDLGPAVTSVDALPVADDLWLLLATPGTALARVRPSGTVVTAGQLDPLATPLSLHRLDDGLLAVLAVRPSGDRQEAMIWLLDDDLTVVRAATFAPWTQVGGAGVTHTGLLVVGSTIPTTTEASDPTWTIVGRTPADDASFVTTIDHGDDTLHAATRLPDGSLVLTGASAAAVHLVHLEPDGTMRRWLQAKATAGQLTLPHVGPTPADGWAAWGEIRADAASRAAWLAFDPGDALTRAVTLRATTNATATDTRWLGSRTLLLGLGEADAWIAEASPGLRLADCEDALEDLPNVDVSRSAPVTLPSEWGWVEHVAQVTEMEAMVGGGAAVPATVTCSGG